jgi:hypothetical protein
MLCECLEQSEMNKDRDLMTKINSRLYTLESNVPALQVDGAHLRRINIYPMLNTIIFYATLLHTFCTLSYAVCKALV